MMNGLGLSISRRQWSTASAGVSDPHWTNVKLLIGADTSVVDESASARTLTSTGATRTTSNPKFGTASVVSSTTGPIHVRAADSADWNFGSGHFTIEMFVRFTSDPANTIFISQFDTGTNQRSWRFGMTPNLDFRGSTNGSTNFAAAGTWAPSLNTWYHVAVDYDGTTYRVYSDGVMRGKLVATNTLFDSNAALCIGHQLNSGAVASQMPAQFDEIRITKGTARYASDAGYTVPTAAFPRS